MIIFDLKCGAEGHIFEGWFSSSEDYQSQLERGLLACPICEDRKIGKAVMAPAVSAKGNQRSGRLPVPAHDNAAAVSMQNGTSDPRVRELLHKLAEAQAETLAKSEWVGRDFADKARAMHYGEEDAKLIHGEVAAREARELIEEGVEVAPLLFPVVPPDAQN